MRNLLRCGNTKLGAGIWHFDLPAPVSCPGATPSCRRVCYARSGRFRTPRVRDRLRANLAAARQPDFADRMAAEVRRRGAFVVRVHVSGDFFSAAYAAAWLGVFRACPWATFYFYTRSWRVEAVAPVLADMAALGNVRAWYSADADAYPTVIPPGVRVAYLQTEVGDLPAGDLAFRVRPLRREPARTSLPVVCPHETPAGVAADVNCGNCQHCWR